MKIDFDTVITDFDDKPATMAEGQSNTLKGVCIAALSVVFADEPGLGGEEKYKRGALAFKISKGGVIHLTAEQVSLLKLLIGKAWPPMIVWRAQDLLEGTKPDLEVVKDAT